MSNECSPEAADRVVAFCKTINSDEGVAVSGRRSPSRADVSRATLYLAHVRSLSQEIPPSQVVEHPQKSIWSWVFDFFAEGFANCGASLYPAVVYLNAGALPLDREVLRRDVPAASERRAALFLVPSHARSTTDDSQAPNGIATEGGAPSAQEIEPSRRWDWLTSCWEVIAAIRAYMRQEREIREAIYALTALDDLTLKDIGIPHRCQIEHAVRNGNDC